MKSRFMPDEFVEKIMGLPDGADIFIALLEGALDVAVQRYTRCVEDRPRDMDADTYEQMITDDSKRRAVDIIENVFSAMLNASNETTTSEEDK